MEKRDWIYPSEGRDKVVLAGRGKFHVNQELVIEKDVLQGSIKTTIRRKRENVTYNLIQYSGNDTKNV